MIRLRNLVLIILLKATSSCVTSGDSEWSLSGQPLVFATIDLFSQLGQFNGKSLQGDWEFRRDRLEVADDELREIRPEVIFFQNSMRRSGSPSEDDSLILKAGALSRYQWENQVIDTVEDTGEDRMLAVAVLNPLTIVDADKATPKSFWQLATDGYVKIFKLGQDKDAILLVNVLMPSRKDQVNLWYSFLQERIQESQKAFDVCNERIVVAGYLPFEGEARKQRDFLTKLQLKDSGAGFCQNAEKCFTASASNGLFSLTSGDSAAGFLDRIFVHATSEVLKSGVAFTNSRDSSRYKESYGLQKMWASQRYGWFSKVRLPKCH